MTPVSVMSQYSKIDKRTDVNKSVRNRMGFRRCIA